MLFKSDGERSFTRAIARISYANPFLPERIDSEREALGEDFVERGGVWHAEESQVGNPNVARINERVEKMAERLRTRLASGARPNKKEAGLYQELIVYLLYNRYEGEFYQFIQKEPREGKRLHFFAKLRSDLAYFMEDLEKGGNREAGDRSYPPAHLFALFFQVRRAFHHIFDRIIGSSMPMARLRAAIWQSIFTHDLGRYRRSLFMHMGDIATLITGPSGTGKELVAAAIGLARYIPFDPEKQCFARAAETTFLPLNLSALSPTLIESELFGHQRGAFTGALSDREGWLAICPAMGSVFLDEIGEVATAIQVKLLRVLQNRTFQRLGDAKDIRFRGKIIAATNQDLGREMEAGRFRKDFYYRLCSDLVTTPSLGEQLKDQPEDLGRLILFIAKKVAGEEEAGALTGEVMEFVDRRLGEDYPWPGNVRELEQCVRNIMIRGEYQPRRHRSKREEFPAHLLASSFTADELLQYYCTLIYTETGSYQETARRLNLDRRTVKSKIETRAG